MEIRCCRKGIFVHYQVKILLTFLKKYTKGTYYGVKRISD